MGEYDQMMENVRKQLRQAGLATEENRQAIELTGERQNALEKSQKRMEAKLDQLLALLGDGDD